ncbi:hypothetical protein SPI_04414 [Niveomyces insectorum RCEF 264]|uniref:Uncharacterized protein n=1 Tax=Niveomyces insectorum RCEF 264 TaxID=1081102 RepID=A0A167VQA1_9HYPO|nr:hypothetical protein SPI_04414 [Niveomyces insectorum RCEF 264]
MASQPVPDDWENIPDEDTFSVLSVPLSDPDADTVLVAVQQNTPYQSSPSLSAERPTAPIAIPDVGLRHEAARASTYKEDDGDEVEDDDIGAVVNRTFNRQPASREPVSADDFDSLPVLHAAALVRDDHNNMHRGSPPPYADLRPASRCTGSAASYAVDDDDDVGDHLTEGDVEPHMLLCGLALLESSRSAAARAAAEELAPIRRRWGDRVQVLCARLGGQADALQAILAGYDEVATSARMVDTAGPPGSVVEANVEATFYLDPALPAWLRNVKEQLLALHAVVLALAQQSACTLFEDATRDFVVDGPLDGPLGCVYAALTDAVVQMDAFLPIMEADYDEFKRAREPPVEPLRLPRSVEAGVTY